MNSLRSLDELNWWLKRVAPRVTLRLSTTEVIATSSDGEVRLPAVISFVREGDNYRIAGVGDDPVDTPGAATVHLFTSGGNQRDQHGDLLARFFSLVLKRLPRSLSIIRPVIVVLGSRSLAPEVSNERIARALESAGAAAVVVDSSD